MSLTYRGNSKEFSCWQLLHGQTSWVLRDQVAEVENGTYFRSESNMWVAS